MIIELLHFIIGIAFLLFIPGYLLSLVLFKKLEILERIALAIGLSISIDVILGLIFGFNKLTAQITGGISGLKIWLGLISVSLVLSVVYYKRNKFQYNTL